jgi:hypothetical protein
MCSLTLTCSLFSMLSLLVALAVVTTRAAAVERVAIAATYPASQAVVARRLSPD